MENQSHSRSEAISFGGTLIVAIVACWGLAWLGPLSLLVPLLIIGFVVFGMLQRQYLATIVFVVTTPLTISFAGGVLGYVSGHGALVFRGYPAPTAWNLDPELRCRRATGGCIVSDNEWIFDGAHNLGLRTSIRLFGPMRGAYTGPYPTREQVAVAMAGSEAVSSVDLKSDTFVLGGDTIRLESGVGSLILDRLNYQWLENREQPREIHGVTWEGECVLLRIPVPAKDEKVDFATILFSRSAGRPFAWYPEGLCEFARVPPWRDRLLHDRVRESLERADAMERER